MYAIFHLLLFYFWVAQKKMVLPHSNRINDINDDNILIFGWAIPLKDNDYGLKILYN